MQSMQYIMLHFTLHYNTLPNFTLIYSTLRTNIVVTILVLLTSVVFEELNLSMSLVITSPPPPPPPPTLGGSQDPIWK